MHIGKKISQQDMFLTLQITDGAIYLISYRNIYLKSSNKNVNKINHEIFHCIFIPTNTYGFTSNIEKN